MTKWAEALAIVQGAVGRLAARTFPIERALGLVVAEDVPSPEDLPPFDNSAMDGFAVRHSDCAKASPDRPVSLRVLGGLAAGGVAAGEVSAGTALRIMTGAALPRGCDAVIPIENTRPSRSDPENCVDVLRSPKVKGNIRFAGEDIRAGETALSRGEAITPAHIGLLAALGICQAPIFPPLKVAVITTGSELVDASDRPGPGKIRDANLHSLSAQIRSWGGVPIAFPRIDDTRRAIEEALAKAVGECDLLLTTGGVSVGDYDHVKEALAGLGAERHFWRVAQKPGGPMGFWTLLGRPFFGIPGNPVSAMVMAELYIKPAMRRMMGWAEVRQAGVPARLEAGFRKSCDDGKRHFLRALAKEQDGLWTVRLAGPQGSAQLTTMRAANALAMIPEEVVEVLAGGEVETLLLC